MPYDLQLIHEFCGEIGLRSSFRSPDELHIELADMISLVFLNDEKEEDCLVAFEGTPWHTHGDFYFADRHGYYLEQSYLDVIAGIIDGQTLVCEQWIDGDLKDRWLVHRDYIDEFRYMEVGEEIRIWRYLP